MQFVRVKEHLKMPLWAMKNVVGYQKRLKNVCELANCGLKKTASILPLPVMRVHTYPRSI